MSAVLAPVDAVAYFAESIADELEIARLLGWGNLPTLAEGMRSGYAMFGTNGGERGHAARLGTKPMPRWRRSWDGAGELIARCNLSVMPGLTCVVVDWPYSGGDMVDTNFSSHPTKDDAFRYVICKAAIANLTAERAPKEPA